MSTSRTIDTREMSEEQFRSLGHTPTYCWRDKESGDIWPTVKLLDACVLVLWDGKQVSAAQGDYIVRCQEEPPLYGCVAYFAHETRMYVEPVHL